MNNYIFLKSRRDEERDYFFAISPERIETLNVCDTYDQFGQKVGHYNAGDYHFDNSACDIINACTKEVAEKFGIDYEDIHIVDGFYEFIIEPGDGEQYGFDESAVNEFIGQYRKENETLTECKGFTYWDGHNWRTIITESDFDEPTHEIVTDEALIAELRKAIDEKELQDNKFGEEIYEGNGYKVIDSHFASSWAAYRLIAVEDYELQAQSY